MSEERDEIGRRIVDPRIDPSLSQFCQRAIDLPPDPIDNELPYGHILRVVAQKIYGVATRERGGSPEEQREAARQAAIYQVRRFGTRIVPFLKKELQDVLTPEDLT